MTFQDLERDVYRRLNKGTAQPNPETQARIRTFLNQRHRRILRTFPQLLDGTITVTSVANQQAYAVPEQGIAKIRLIHDPTNRIALAQRSVEWLRATDQDPSTTTGLSSVWIPQTYQQVHTQPSNASAIFVDSTSASDTGTAYIVGTITGGYRRTVEVTMTGTTAVDISSGNTDWISIEKFYLNTPAIGTVTLHEDAEGGTELSHIAPGDTYAKFLGFMLYPTPSSAIAYTLDITRNATRMAKPLDEPLLPEHFHDLIAIGARVDEYEHTDDASRRAAAESEWAQGWADLTLWMVSNPSTHLSLGGVEQDPTQGYAGAGSRLGGWFPRD